MLASYRRLARLVIVVALLLMVPLVAMRVTGEVQWTPFDFLAAGVMLLGTGLAYELVAGRSTSGLYRAAAALGLGSALFLLWANLAVGIIGSEDNPANWMYVGVLAVGVIGAIIARFQPRGMARALVATAVAQALAGVIAMVLQLGDPFRPLEIVGTTGMFVALFLGSAWLFQRAGRTPYTEPGTRPFTA